MREQSCKLLAVVLLTGLILAGCSAGRRALQVKGSDTMVNLAQAWTEEYMKTHPDQPVAVTGGGSGTGIASLINRSADIALCSREMKKKEIDIAKAKGVDPFEVQVANDGIAVVISPKNPVDRLTLNQLSDIFAGKIKNWNELGGPNREIVALSRDRNSGTHVFFLEHVVKLKKKDQAREFASGVLMLPSNQAIVEEVAGSLGAIGYIGLGYMEKRLKAVAVADGEGRPYVIPNDHSVLNKSYPISRSLLFYTNGEPKGGVKEFIDYVLSPAWQKVVLSMDFVPARNASHSDAGGPIK